MLALAAFVAIISGDNEIRDTLEGRAFDELQAVKPLLGPLSLRLKQMREAVVSDKESEFIPQMNFLIQVVFSTRERKKQHVDEAAKKMEAATNRYASASRYLDAIVPRGDFFARSIVSVRRELVSIRLADAAQTRAALADVTSTFQNTLGSAMAEHRLAKLSKLSSNK